MEYFFIHSEWNDICIIDENNIYRKNIINERGYFYYNNDNLIIKWDNWDDENIFSKYEDFYIDKNIINDIEIMNIKNNDKYILLLNTNKIIKYNNHNNRGTLTKNNKLYHIKWQNNDEYLYLKNNIYYDIESLLESNNSNNINENKNNTNQYINNNTNNTNQNYFNLNDINLNEDDCDDIEDEKNINEKYLYELIDGVVYSKLYLNKNIINSKKKYYSYKFNDSYIKEENLFYNLKIYNQYYIDYDNYKKYTLDYVINNHNNLNKFFNINVDIDLNINTVKKKIVTLCEWGYPPFGGGENWLLNINKIFHDLNYECYMICFSDGFTGQSYQDINIIDLNYVKVIQMPYILIEIFKILKVINPIIINHQGIKRIEFLKIANVLQIPFITGFCFWNNIIKQLSSNINMLENNDLEKDLSFLYINEYSYTYCASDFVNDIILKYFNQKINVIETISLKEDYYVNNRENYYVTMLNCHYSKGGFILKYLLENLNNKIPLLLVYTENDDIININEIKELVKKRNLINDINILYEKKQNVKEIYKKTKIMLVPSLCDETFCRVAYESKMNNIPIISTRSGNLKYLMKNYAIFLQEKPEQWKIEIEKLYFKKSYNINKNNNVIDFIENNVKNKIYNLLNNSVKSKYNFNNKNIGIIAPWADQGLGIQARSYYNSLINIGYKPFVFSFKPYHGNESNNFLQVDKNEWNYDNIYYSNNNRENINHEEILNFIHNNNIKKIIIIEASFEPIFKIVSLFKLLNIYTILVINIECLKITEINYHSLFDRILCNNFNSYFIMNNLIQNKCNYLGFHLENEYFENYIKNNKKDKKLNFVCSGGLNSISRKNIDLIYEIFLELYESKKFENEVNLNILIQGVEIPKQLGNKKNENINIKVKNFSYKENLNNISENDIFIHCGGQEGLGLGFYEALYLGIPIITLNWTPNNEIIKNNVNGWLIDCNYDKVYENNECIINRGIIKKDSLKNKIENITTNIDSTIRIINKTIDNRNFFINKNKNKFEKKLDIYLSSMPCFN